ncbi:TetR family transcriptional regulator [Streptomyces sp. JJ36]|uniref:TetR/AcrR family transcriptional regulator n=1 Tax=Streptomyces sp. JJ36 TaxID=2736645 RepID=UPI001F021CF7|nr:TetR family transcriptional regulator [Streptomyces sp. JJ36]MCF6523699.1 TetR family transcriptional regulator [Streptomyces sp. JJ36]
MTARAGRPARRRGRPATTSRTAGEPATRDRILASARTEFAARGFDRASIRGIARGAEVDPALVHHYFGPKEQVFEAAVENALAPILGKPDEIAAGALEDAGAQMVRFVFGLWENPATREPLLAIVRSAVNNETAAAIFRGLVTRHMVSRLAAAVPGPRPELRVELAVAQLIGTAMLRYVIRMEPVASADVEELKARLEPVVRHHLTADLPGEPPDPAG